MSWFGDAWSGVKDLWQQEGEEQAFGFLGATQVPGGVGPAPIPPNAAYVTVKLASLRLVHVRKGLTRFCPVVHSHLSVSHRRGSDAEFRCVTTPNGLMDLDAAHLDRVVQANLPLLGPVPYRAGDIAAEIGLFSLKTADLLQPYLTLLGKVSATAGVSLVDKALPFAALLSEGLQLLTGGAAAQMIEVGYNGGLPAQSGWFVLARAPKGQAQIGTVRVDPTDHRLVLAGGGAPPWPYLLLRIEASDRLDSWTDIPDLFARYDALQKAVVEGKEADVKETLAVFRRFALFCPDLLGAHASKLVKEVEKQVDEAMGEGPAPMTLTSAPLRQRRMLAAAIDPFA
ncbi:hypothetical protein C8P66_13815 [Humitalea rosea]|uniref:Uncharacterized protein n=1 Tax=Humitalea rosea TaxID=990373 RepID=A0A2W7IGS0_9PROT|nr:hypothetical protein [Humitalea rosea]PZW37983.1 hypothetical protein C8P66_13815 [Humitalea rosea]